jgi:ribosomal protein S18 acetylase RimI-like enzyme
MDAYPTASIVYLNSVSSILASELEGFFVGWENPPSAHTLRTILANSHYCILAYDSDKKKVVGFINCISDCVLSAYIPLLEVLPEYQHKGIGRELLRQMIEKTQQYYMVDLCCDEKVASFYSDHDFKRVAGMIRRNYDKQSGL